MSKVTIVMKVVAKRAKVEFKKGMGVGVLVSQEVTFDLPDNYSETMFLASVVSRGDELMKDAVEVQYEVKQ